MNRISSKIFTFGMACALAYSSAVLATPRLTDNAPSEYLVEKGDTLWDISGVFLKSPWRWPEIWKRNSQIANPDLIYPNDIIYLQYENGEPYLSKHKKGVVKLQPKIRRLDKFAALSVVPESVIKPFLTHSRVVKEAFFETAPYVVDNVKKAALISSGDSVFVKGRFDMDYPLFDIFRRGDVHKGDSPGASDSFELFKVGEVEIVQDSDVLAQGVVVTAAGVIRPGDYLIPPAPVDAGKVYNLAAAPEGVSGRIIKATGLGQYFSRYDGAMINLGTANGLVQGHVLKVLSPDKVVVDPITKEKLVVGTGGIGNLLVVNAFDNVSYAIVLNATEVISLNDRVVSVKQ